jgi:hypothetical protein
MVLVTDALPLQKLRAAPKESASKEHAITEIGLTPQGLGQTETAMAASALRCHFK